MQDKRHDKNKNPNKRAEDIKYCRGLKDFLRTFKTTPCPLSEEHRLEFCPHYHSLNDRRRNPYCDSGFLYYLDQQCGCDNPVPPSPPRTALPTTPTPSTSTTHTSTRPPSVTGCPVTGRPTPAGCCTRASRRTSSRASSSGSTLRPSRRCGATVRVTLEGFRPARTQGVPVLPQREGPAASELQRLFAHPVQ
jgi:hypothetical protein